jgi:class 3 adenylate cyclase
MVHASEGPRGAQSAVPEPASQLLPASVRSVMQRSEPALGLSEAFQRDLAALTFRRLRIAGVAYAAVHVLLSLVFLFWDREAFFRHYALTRALAVVFSLGLATATYAKNLERRSFALAIMLTLGTVLFILVPIWREGVLRGADHGHLVLLVVCTGLLFPFTMRQMLLVSAGVFILYLAAALHRFRIDDVISLTDGIFYLSAAGTIATVGAHLGSGLRTREFRARFELSREREAADQLLRSILPESIVERLKRDQSAIAEGFMDATVLFADIVGFTPLSAKMAPGKLVEMLNDVFSKFDALSEKYGLEKIKTIGDAYMVVGGVPTPRKDHATAVANMAVEMRDLAEHLRAPTGDPIRIRIGINSGPVVAGVIGTTKFSYDLWGDTVNTAARMEAHAEPGTIHVTERTCERIRTQFQLEARGNVEIKGKGTMKTYVLVGPRRSLRPPPKA